MTRTVIAESRWNERTSGCLDGTAELIAYRRVVVVAAHPDDETLALGGFLQTCHDAGADLTLVVATRGEGALPAAGSDERAALARERTAELAEAFAVLGLGDVPVHWLDLPDSALAEHEDVLTERLTTLLRDADCVLLPWPGDPHPDHAAAGRAALAAAPAEAHRWSYPIWLWHWIAPDDPGIPWPTAAALPLSDAQRRRKARALATFESQLRPGPRGEPPILDTAVLTHFDRDREVLFREPRSESAPVARFADLYRADEDPWDTTSSWYERRKRQILLACLPKPRYRLALEPGCGSGALTVELQDRCDRVLAFDPVPAAVAAAAAAGARDVAVAAVPHDVPRVRADLVVCGELLYYLSDPDLESTVDRLVATLEPGGDLVAVHWLGWPAEAPRDAVATHRHLTGRPELTTLVEHVDEEFLLHVLRRT